MKPVDPHFTVAYICNLEVGTIMYTYFNIIHQSGYCGCTGEGSALEPHLTPVVAQVTLMLDDCSWSDDHHHVACMQDVFAHHTSIILSYP